MNGHAGGHGVGRVGGAGIGPTTGVGVGCASEREIRPLEVGNDRPREVETRLLVAVVPRLAVISHGGLVGGRGYVGGDVGRPRGDAVGRGGIGWGVADRLRCHTVIKLMRAHKASSRHTHHYMAGVTN